MIYTQTLNPLLPYKHSIEVPKCFKIKSRLEHLNHNPFYYYFNFKKSLIFSLLQKQKKWYVIQYSEMGKIGKKTPKKINLEND